MTLPYDTFISVTFFTRAVLLSARERFISIYHQKFLTIQNFKNEIDDSCVVVFKTGPRHATLIADLLIVLPVFMGFPTLQGQAWSLSMFVNLSSTCPSQTQLR